jgi:hypothetical protein
MNITKIINYITNVCSFLLVLCAALQTYFTQQPFNWLTFAVCICGAVVAYFTGKSKLWNE